MKKTPINPSGTGWAQACAVDQAERFVFIAGQVPQGKDGVIPANISDQCRLAWANVVHQLETAGLKLENLVSVRVYLTDRQYIPEMIAVRNEVLGMRAEPAFTVVLAGLYDARWCIEIESIAAA